MTQRWSPYSRFSVSVNFKTILSISSMIFKRKIWLSCVVKYDEAFELPVHLHRHSILIKYYIHLHGSTQLSMSATSFNQTHQKSYTVNKWFNKIKISVDTLQIDRKIRTHGKAIIYKIIILPFINRGFTDIRLNKYGEICKFYYISLLATIHFSSLRIGHFFSFNKT